MNLTYPLGVKRKRAYFVQLGPKSSDISILDAKGESYALSYVFVRVYQSIGTIHDQAGVTRVDHGRV